jgi:hypothetical protein
MAYHIVASTYGGMRVNDNVTAQTIGDVTPVLINQLDTEAPASDDVAVDVATTFDITVPDAGDYQLKFVGNVSGTVSITWTFEFYVNDVATGLIGVHDVSAGGETETFVMDYDFPLAAEDAVSVKALASAAGSDLLIEQGSFSVHKRN